MREWVIPTLGTFIFWSLWCFLPKLTTRDTRQLVRRSVRQSVYLRGYRSAGIRSISTSNAPHGAQMSHPDRARVAYFIAAARGRGSAGCQLHCLLSPALHCTGRPITR